MSVTTQKARPPAGKNEAEALPKVNVRPAPSGALPPSSFAPEAEQGRLTAAQSPHPSPLFQPKRKDWDMRFALALILVVVVVNVTLTLVLGGGSGDQAEIALHPDDAAMDAPEVERRADVYISSEEKRLLLRHLYNDAGPSASAPESAQQGTYRALSEDRDRGLSIIGATPSAGR